MLKVYYSLVPIPIQGDLDDEAWHAVSLQSGRLKTTSPEPSGRGRHTTRAAARNSIDSGRV
jgi:hypothetical protein